MGSSLQALSKSSLPATLVLLSAMAACYPATTAQQGDAGLSAQVDASADGSVLAADCGCVDVANHPDAQLRRDAMAGADLDASAIEEAGDANTDAVSYDVRFEDRQMIDAGDAGTGRSDLGSIDASALEGGATDAAWASDGASEDAGPLPQEACGAQVQDGSATTGSRTYRYDTQGQQIYYSSDEDGDGQPEVVISRDFTPEGQIMTEYYLQYGYTYSLSYTYDAYGRLARVEKDEGPDTVIDSRDDYTYRTDTLDDPRIDFIDTSNAPFQRPNKRQTYLYATDAPKPQRINVDYGANGSIDAVTKFTYNNGWQPLTEIFDANNDGLPEIITYYTYDDLGRIIIEEVDLHGDTTIDMTTTYNYVNGRLVSEHTENADFTSVDIIYQFVCN